MTMLNNYDRIASYYDGMSRLVFGQSQVRAQQALLPLIQSPGRVLVVGGGTGWILQEIAKVQPSGLDIDYVEISSNMLDLARAQPRGNNRVSFIHSAIEDYVMSTPYEVILTPFLFDNFSRERAAIVFKKLNTALKTGGLWLFTDFHIDVGLRRFWQKALLRSMYLFFRNISHVEADQLPDMQSHFNASQFQILSESFYFGRFIRSAAYRKSGDGGATATENKPLVEDYNR